MELEGGAKRARVAVKASAEPIAGNAKRERRSGEGREGRNPGEARSHVNFTQFQRFFKKCPPASARKVRKLQMEESREGESRSTATAQLVDGKSSERGRQVQASWNRKTATG